MLINTATISKVSYCQRPVAGRSSSLRRRLNPERGLPQARLIKNFVKQKRMKFYQRGDNKYWAKGCLPVWNNISKVFQRAE